MHEDGDVILGKSHRNSYIEDPATDGITARSMEIRRDLANRRPSG